MWPNRPAWHGPVQCGLTCPASPKRPGRHGPEHMLLMLTPSLPKRPAAHGAHWLLPFVAENIPAWHGMHIPLALWLNLPGTHTPEQSADGLPPLPKRPSWHDRHRSCPAPEYFPGAHVLHPIAPRAALKWPAEHVWQRASVFLRRHHLPTGHFMHLADLLKENCPGRHFAHVTAPRGAFVPEGHSSQALLWEAPVLGFALPVWHRRHTLLAMSNWYCPGAHLVHTPVYPSPKRPLGQNPEHVTTVAPACPQ